MPLPIVARIAEASKAAWPEVAAAMDTNTRTLHELAGVSETVVPKVENYIAKGDGAARRRRKVCEETIWVLADLGWLRTGAEREAILAAKAFVDAINDEDAGDDELAQLEDELTTVINGLPEYLTRPRKEA